MFLATRKIYILVILENKTAYIYTCSYTIKYKHEQKIVCPGNGKNS